MNYERRQAKNEDLRIKPLKEFQQYCGQWLRVFKAWFRLSKALLRVIGLTLKMILSTAFWLLRLMNPIPSTTSTYQKWQRRQETGLRISPWDIAVLTFGIVSFISYSI